MKIIKQGIPQQKPEDKLYTGSCYNCGCEVECKQSELQYYGEAPYPGTFGSFVECPTNGCNTRIGMMPKIVYTKAPVGALL